AGLGAVTALAIGRGVGWIGAATTATVVVPSQSQPRPVSAQAIAHSAAKPLVGNGFDPAQLYNRRAAGVATIYALFGDQQAATQASQGAGFVVAGRGYGLTRSHVSKKAGVRE